MKINCGDNIRKYREYNNLTQRELADKINVSHATIHSWETNRTEPKMGAIEKLCTIFGCSKTELIGLDEQITLDSESALGIIEANLPYVGLKDLFTVNQLVTDRMATLVNTMEYERTEREEPEMEEPELDR